MQQPLSRREFVSGAGALAATVVAGAPAASSAQTSSDTELGTALCTTVREAPDRATGPMIGHVDDHEVRLWYRPSQLHHDYDQWICRLQTAAAAPQEFPARLDRDHDFTLHFFLTGLQSDTEYEYRIEPAGETGEWAAAEQSGGRLRTLNNLAGNAQRVVLGLGSCAPSTPDPVWTRILDEGCQGFVFLGDTPYVDSDQLSVARKKHREFLSQPEIAAMIRKIPCWGTWDDHDFGLNDGHGDFSGKHVCRLAFTEYRANRSFGHDDEGREQVQPFGAGRGIQTSFRFGPLEVFLLDPRWFSRTEASWADKTKPTCLGRAQWEWLQTRLLASRATFKAITTGMIWDDKKNSEKDDWETYAHEREALLDMIQAKKIGGCFLVGGDIHVSRALHYGPRVGYPLWQFIVSPLHERTIPSLNVPHPALVHAAVEPNVFLRLEADDKQLLASWIGRDGKRLFEVTLNAAELTSGG